MENPLIRYKREADEREAARDQERHHEAREARRRQIEQEDAMGENNDAASSAWVEARIAAAIDALRTEMVDNMENAIGLTVSRLEQKFERKSAALPPEEMRSAIREAVQSMTREIVTEVRTVLAPHGQPLVDRHRAI